MDKLNITIIGVPMDLGQNRRGVDMGPSAIRYAGAIERLKALGHTVKDKGDIVIGRKEMSKNTKLRNLEEVVEGNTKLANEVREIIAEGDYPLIFGGDHSIAIGTLAGLADKYKNLGVIWYDAHAEELSLVREDRDGHTAGVPVVLPKASLGSYVWTG